MDGGAIASTGSTSTDAAAVVAVVINTAAGNGDSGARFREMVSECNTTAERLTDSIEELKTLLAFIASQQEWPLHQYLAAVAQWPTVSDLVENELPSILRDARALRAFLGTVAEGLGPEA